MAAVATFLVILSASLIVVRVAAVALTMTGLSHDVARFQALSAWTGTGFTTSESEGIVGHAVRRRIVSLLMTVRNAGLITALTTLILSFVNISEQEDVTRRIVIILSAVLVLWVLSISRLVDRRLSRVIRWCLLHWTQLQAHDYAALLHLTEDYSVAQMSVEAGGWLEGCTLGDLDLSREGVLVLAVERAGGNFIGAARGGTKLHGGDTILAYGRQEALTKLTGRPVGDEGRAAHIAAVAEESNVRHVERVADDEAATS